MDKHITLVGILNIGFGLLGIMAAVILFVTLIGAGILSGDAEAVTILSIIGTILAFFFAILSLPKIIAGIGVLKRRQWGRVISLIIAVLDLFAIPFGTALGVYTLWALLNEETAKLFNATSNAQ